MVRIWRISVINFLFSLHELPLQKIDVDVDLDAELLPLQLQLLLSSRS